MKILFRVAVIYQIAIWIITVYGYSAGILNSIWTNKDSVSFMASIAVIVFSVIVLISNLYLLIGNNTSKYFKNLVFNKWLNFLQIINISLLGLSFYLTVGIQILVYYIYDNSQRISLVYGFFKLRLNCTYVESNIIFVGVNILPLFLFFIFNKVIEQKKLKMISDLIS